MKNTEVSKVMLSTVVAGGVLFSSLFTISASGELKEPIVTKEETQIELPSSAYIFPTLDIQQQKLEEIKAEGKKLQLEREEAELQLYAQVEAEREAREEAERKAREEEQRKREEAERGIAFNGSYYTPYCEGCTGVTATGVDVRNTVYHQGMRVIAVDPKVVPLHSIVQVTTPHESFKAIALDTGGAIKGHKVDILVANKQNAINLGRHTVYIKVLRSGK